jgi:hypothetical protein
MQSHAAASRIESLTNAERGTTLIEVLVAMGVTVTGALAMAQLLTAAAATNAMARSITVTTVLAAQKLEELRAFPPPPSIGTLQRNTPGYVDYVDGFGRVVNGTRRGATTVFTRRWQIELLPSDPDAAVVQVRVMRQGTPSSAEVDPGGAHLSTIVRGRTP